MARFARFRRFHGVMSVHPLGWARRACAVPTALLEMVGTPSGAHSRDSLALPTLIWGLLSQASQPGLGIYFYGMAQRRCAEPCVAQRTAAVDALRD